MAALPRVAIVTELGTLELELEAEKASLTTANFLRYVEDGFYNSTYFYRTVKPDNQPDNLVKIEVIQGGGGMEQLSVPGKALYPSIPLERTSLTGLKHLDGTLSMARLVVDGANSEFFICVGDQPELDFGGKRNPDGQGFAAFGRIVGGREVVERIHQSPAEGQRLTPPIKIISVYRIKDEG